MMKKTRRWLRPGLLLPTKHQAQINWMRTESRQQQSPSKAEARGLLQRRGYNSINTLQPQPNSIWVWQADVIKNGRPSKEMRILECYTETK